jgi:RHS repeat-associated protein
MRGQFFDASGNFLRAVSVSLSEGNAWQELRFDFEAEIEGTLQVFVGSESDVSVWYDDLRIAWEQALIVQENHYYPFGMNLVGIEKRGNPEDRFQYNGKEKQEGFGLNWADYGARFYDNALGRFFTKDRFAEKYYNFTPYQYGANNPIKYIDVNGDSIYIYHRKEKILYHDGNLYLNGNPYTQGKAFNKKGQLKGFVKKSKNALDKIKDGGDAGKELIDYFENSAVKNIEIQESNSGNGESRGKIKWNPNSTLSEIPNQDGSKGRESFIGLAHEIGHSWDREENGWKNIAKIWYKASNDDVVSESEKIATWWENRIRTENGVSLREFYSFTQTKDEGGNIITKGDEAGRLVKSGTRDSIHLNMIRRRLTPSKVGSPNNTPYKY